MSDRSLKSEMDEIDTRDFRNALGSFVTGVTAVTTAIGGRPIGFTANSFTSVSLSPPLVLVCIGKTSSNYDEFMQTEHFCINILAENQRSVSQKFAAKGVDRFTDLAWSPGILGSPVIKDSIAWFQCSLHERVDAGDHQILIGRVRDFGHQMGSPLAYCRGNYVLFELEQRVLDSSRHSAQFGAILESPEGIVFVPGKEKGTLMLPNAARLGTKEAKEGLYATLSSLGMEFNIEFLFSVWESNDADQLNVYYRGDASGQPTADQVRLIPINQIPYDALGYDDGRLLKRYSEERRNFRFSLYAGTSSSGDWWEVSPRRVG